MSKMTIIVDSREHKDQRDRIFKHFDELGAAYVVSKLYTGDYMSLDNARLVVDRKHNLSEVCINLCQDRPRFVRELKRAQDAGIKIVFLVEHGRGYKTLEDVQKWVNPRSKVSPMAANGERLYRVMLALRNTYGIEWRFCTKAETGKEIVKILGGDG